MRKALSLPFKYLNFKIFPTNVYYNLENCIQGNNNPRF